jgi:linoleoyl-CoA desaturase
MKAISPIRFNNPEQTDFVRTLRKRVDDYFKSNGISKTGGIKLKLKAVFMFLLYTVPYFAMLFGLITNVWIMWGMTALMGLGMAGIGFSVMHDANHGSFSRKAWVNKFMGFSINFLGGNVNNWKIQHNLLHHSYTNIEGYDEDIAPAGILRFSPHSEKKKIHKYQFLYAWFFYGLMTLSWTFSKDFFDIFRYEKMGLFKQLRTNIKREFWLILSTRVVYFIYMMLIPLLVLDVSFWQWLLGFLTVHYIAGFVLASVFQLAHVMEDTDFPMPEKGNVSNQWAVHQLNTTLNFARKNKVLSWFVGGLNFQVEHHLFPNISHVHYPKIAPIVEATAREFGLPYFAERSFRSALSSHARMLYQLGR